MLKSNKTLLVQVEPAILDLVKRGIKPPFFKTKNESLSRPKHDYNLSSHPKRGVSLITLSALLRGRGMRQLVNFMVFCL